MFRKALIVNYIIIAIFFGSCQKEDDPNAPKQGSVTGKLRLADEFGTLLPDHGQVILTSNTNQRGSSLESGSFLIYGFDDGTFDITYTKNGFGEYKRFGIPVTNPGITELIGIDTLGKKSTTIISSLSVSPDTQNSTYSFNCTVTPAPDAVNQRGIRLFFSKNADVSSDNYEYTPGNKWLADNATGAINNFNSTNLLNNGFGRGDTVYLVAYGESFYSNIYIDPLSSKKVFPNLNTAHPSNTVQFILP